MKRVLFLGLLFVFGTNTLSAQTEPWARDVYLNGDENQPTLKLLLSDFNGDNRLDIISAEKAWSVYGSAAFKISYRLNTQSGNEYGFFPNYANLKYYLAQNIDYTFMDMDTINAIAGGVQELAVGYRQVTGGVTSHKVDILKKSGSTFIQDYTITLPASSSDIKLVRTGSFDGVASTTTQLSDLAVASGDKVYIYLNNKDNPIKFGRTDPGLEGQPNFTIQASGMGTVMEINTGEFYNSGYSYDHNEGYNEILTIDYNTDDRVRRWKNNTPEAGANWFVQFAGDPLINPQISSSGMDYKSYPIWAADMNNDGLQDFIMKPGIRLNSTGNPFSWPANAQYWAYNLPMFAYNPHAGNVAIADFNNDGKMDIVGCFRNDLLSIPSSASEFPFICYNDGGNYLPDDWADVVFYDYFGDDYPSQSMMMLTGDITGKGAASVARLTNTGNPSYMDRRIVVYRRTDNPAPAPPKMKNLESKGRRGIQVNWYKNTESDVVGYEIWRCYGYNTTPPSSYNLIGVTSSASFLDPECVYDPSSPNKVYYKIKAKDNINQLSEFSNELNSGYGLGMGKESENEAANSLKFELSQNYPNPFNPVTMISYAVPFPSKVNLTIYNSLGQVVKVLVNETEESGTKQILWNGKDEKGSEVASGVYVYKLQIGRQIAVKKMMFTK